MGREQNEALIMEAILALLSPEYVAIWEAASWPTRIGILYSLYVTLSSGAAAALPARIGTKGVSRINKFLNGARKIANVSALNVGNAKKKDGD